MDEFYQQLDISPVVSMENQAYSADSCNRCYGLWPLTTALDSMPLTAAMIEQFVITRWLQVVLQLYYTMGRVKISLGRQAPPSYLSRSPPGEIPYCRLFQAFTQPILLNVLQSNSSLICRLLALMQK